MIFHWKKFLWFHYWSIFYPVILEFKFLSFGIFFMKQLYQTSYSYNLKVVAKFEWLCSPILFAIISTDTATAKTYLHLGAKYGTLNPTHMFNTMSK